MSMYHCYTIIPPVFWEIIRLLLVWQDLYFRVFSKHYDACYILNPRSWHRGWCCRSFPKTACLVWAIASLSCSIIWKSPRCSSDQLRFLWNLRGKSFPIWPTLTIIHRQQIMGGGEKKHHLFADVFLVDIVFWVVFRSKFSGFISCMAIPDDFLPVETWPSRIPRCWCQETFTKKPWALRRRPFTKIDFTKFVGSMILDVRNLKWSQWISWSCFEQCLLKLNHHLEIMSLPFLLLSQVAMTRKQV